MMDISKTINLCLSKDDGAYQKLYDAMYSTVYNTCMRYATNESNGKDYIQECYIKIFNKLDSFIGDTMGDLGAWVKKICVNYCVDQSRGFKPLFCDYVTAMNVEVESDDINIKYEFTLNQILSSIHRLSPRYKTVFNMYVLDGYNHDEITRELGLNPGTSKANLFKAKRKIRQLLLEIA